jgi:hypothetical protein
MENSSKVYREVLAKIQQCLNEYKCKSEIKISEKEASLYGKFIREKEKHTIVVHLKEEGYILKSSGSGKVEAKDFEKEKHIMPSLDMPFFRAQNSKLSFEDQVAIKNKFLEEAGEIGKVFLKKVKK